MSIDILDLGMLPEVHTRVHTTNKLYEALKPIARIALEGEVISIDPSVGSKSSMPGYAVFSKGKLKDYGTIEIDTKLAQHLRIHELARALREDFGRQSWDLLIVEALPVLRFESFGRSLASQVPLHRAVGAIFGAVQAKHCVEVTPQTWHSFVAPAYDKSDDKDAVAFGHVVMCYSRSILKKRGK